MRMDTFYRYQGTDQVEQQSYYVDITLLHEDMQELRVTNPQISLDELKEKLYWKYEAAFNLRVDISGEELFFKVYQAQDEREVEQLQSQYKVNGIFGYWQAEVEEDYTWEELMSGDTWSCEDTTYLTLYEGECLQDEGFGRGVIFRPTRLLNVWKTED